MDLGHILTGPSRAPLVVFLHGFLGSRNDWVPIVRLLEGRFHCLAVDLPGHGMSLHGDEADYTFQSAAASIIDLIDTIDVPSFSLVGYSMGGRLALYLASIYAMRVDALVIESASPGLRTNAERIERRALDNRWEQMLEANDMRSFLNAWYRQPLFGSLASRSDRLEAVISTRMPNDPRELARALRGMSVAVQPSLWDEWRANHIPSLIIAGALDAKYSAIAGEMASMCAASGTRIIPGAGHNVHEEAPDEYNRVVCGFLSGILTNG